MKTSLFSWSMVLVATALVACGDDTSDPSGTGGAGGTDATSSSATQAGPTSVSASSGSPTSNSVQASVSASSGEGAGGSAEGGAGPGPGGSGPGGNGQGGDGQGGSGQGGASNCEATVDIIDVAFDPDNGGYLGLLDPNIGGATDDLGFLVFPNTAATIDLSDPDSAATAFIQGYQDVDFDTGDLAAFFIATQGTITVAAAGWDASGVRLSEADPDTGEILVDGRCLDVNDVSGDVLEPFGWLCPVGFYDAGPGDGCDCECGIPDPDCDIVDPPQTLFGCQFGQTCDANGECAGVPDAWACLDAAYDDGATCDCACGVVDPDCDDPGNNVANCPNADDQCISGTCVPADEAVCVDLLDDDLDGSIDCADADCVGANCTPGTTPADGACDAHNDCDTAAGNDPACVTPAFNVEFNFCSEWCNLANDDCGAGRLCLDVGQIEGLCLTECTDDDECAATFECVDLDGAGTSGCLPAPIPIVVPDTWTCTPGYYGDGLCDCGCGAFDDLDCADQTSAVCEFCEADLSCANDGVSEFDCDVALLVDGDNSVCL